MKARYRLALLAVVLSLSTGCDQATKQMAASGLKASPQQSYVGDLFRLQYAENPGGFLSLGAGLSDDVRLWLFMAGVGVLLVGMLAFALLSSRLGPLLVTSLALFVGGGLSNWIDRVLHGNVVIDFMNVGVGPLRTGVFNVADLCVMAGIVLFLIANLQASRPAPTAGAEREQSTIGVVKNDAAVCGHANADWMW